MKRADIAINHTSPLFEITWEQDLVLRTNPLMFTTYAREQVPVLEFVDWQITSVSPGEAETLLPLNPSSTNQHFTHQAALIVLTADYSGGAALASLFWGWPIIGIHPVDSPKSVSLWLLKAEMKYIRPSTADLTVKATIDKARKEKIQKRFLNGKPVIETITMQFKNGDDVVAEGTCTYFARQSTALRSNGIDENKINPLYALKLTSSAEMIAGVRAMESGRLFSDPYAADMAGQHGMAVATRFCQRTPQLGPMVAARTKHVDDLVMNFISAGGRDIVIMGVGWDMRPFRLDLPAGVRFFELDFPTTLRERCSRIEQNGIQDQAGVSRVQIPIDLRTMSPSETLAGRLPEDKPVLVIWEGMSMYFEEPDVKELLRDLGSLLVHQDSLLWMDIVDREPVMNPGAFPDSVKNFMGGMQVLGEPFMFGCDVPDEFIEESGLRCLEVVTSDFFFPEASDPIFSIYQFCTVAAGSTLIDQPPKTFKKTVYHNHDHKLPKPHFGQGKNGKSVQPSLVEQPLGLEAVLFTEDASKPNGQSV